MKVSILIYSLASGGAERVVSILLKELSHKYEITLFLMNDTIFYDVPENVNIVYLEKSIPPENGIVKLLKLPVLGWKYKKMLKKFNISLSFMNRPNYINILAKIFGSKTKTIISERITSSQEYSTNSVKDKVSRLLIKFLYPKSDLVIPNSKYMEYELKQIFNVKKTKVIYNPIFNTKYSSTFNTRRSKFIFMHVGRMEYQKEHKLLIESFYKANLNAELWLVGHGCLREYLEKRVQELGLTDKIKFLGRQKDVFKFLNQADCFVLSSNYEGFPNVLLEALSCGLPIISTDCRSGPREILAPDTDFRYQTNEIEFAEYGVLVPVNDVEKMAKAMEIIYKNNKLREKYAQKAIKRAKDFDVEKIIKEWEKAIKDLL